MEKKIRKIHVNEQLPNNHIAIIIIIMYNIIIMSRIVLKLDAYDKYMNAEKIENEFSNFTLDKLEDYATNNGCLFRDVAIKVLNKYDYHHNQVRKISKDIDELIIFTFKNDCKNSVLNDKINILNKHFQYLRRIKGYAYII